MQVQYAPRSLQDIEEARDYIAEVLLNPQAANEIVAEIFAAGDRLAEQPCIGSLFHGCTDLLNHYRHLSVHGYLLVYRVQGETVKIVRVLHHLRDIPTVLLGNSQ